jgi:hypothetical protein
LYSQKGKPCFNDWANSKADTEKIAGGSSILYKFRKSANSSKRLFYLESVDEKGEPNAMPEFK